MLPAKKGSCQFHPTMDPDCYNDLPIRQTSAIVAQILLEDQFFFIQGPFHELKPIPDTFNETKNLRLERSCALGENILLLLF